MKRLRFPSQSTPRRDGTMSTSRSLTGDLHFCEVNGQHVFLDLRANRYFAFTRRQSEWFNAIRTTEMPVSWSADTTRFYNSLKSRGLFDDRDAMRTFRPTPSIYWSYADDALARHSKSPALRLCLLTFCVSVLLTAVVWRRHRHNISALLAWTSTVSCNPRHAGKKNAYEAIQFASMFQRMSPLLFNSKDACLFRSLALRKFLSMNKISSQLVIGVRLAPFNAHCWVSQGTQPLNEHPDTANSYTCLLVIA